MPYSQVDPLTPVAKTITLPADGAQHNFPDDGGYRFGFQEQNGLEFLGRHEVAAVARVREAECLQAIEGVLDGGVGLRGGLGPLAPRRFRCCIARRGRGTWPWHSYEVEIHQGMRAESAVGALDKLLCSFGESEEVLGFV